MFVAVPISLYNFSSTFIFSNTDIISLHFLYLGSSSADLQSFPDIMKTKGQQLLKVIICGDIKINYLENCTRRQQLDLMLATCNLIGTVRFPTRVTSESISEIDNLFVDKTRNYTVSQGQI